MTPTPRTMLLIDADNVSADVIAQAVERISATHGAIHVRRAYCTAESAVTHAKLFKSLSIRPIVNLSAGKNSNDIALAVDAIDLAISERPGLVVIVSSDSDFAPLVIRLREKGCRVEGIGQLGKTGDEAPQAYDHFEDLTHRKSGRAPRTAPAAAPKAPARRSTRAQTPAVPPKPAAPTLPQEVLDILDAVPQLRDGAWLELRMAAEPLRKAKLLGKTAASTKLFKKHAALFRLEPEKAPNQVRFLG